MATSASQTAKEAHLNPEYVFATVSLEECPFRGLALGTSCWGRSCQERMNIYTSAASEATSTNYETFPSKTKLSYSNTLP